MLAGVLVTPVLTRSLGVDEYGRVSLAIVLMQISLVFLTFGLPLVITRHMFRETSGEAGAGALATVGALSVLAVFGAGACFVALALLISKDDLSLALPLAVTAGAAGAGIAMCQAWSVATERASLYIALAFGNGLLAPVAGLFSVLLTSRSATGYMVGVVCVVVLVDVAAIRFVMPPGAWSLIRSAFGRSLRIGLPLVPHQLAVNSATGAAVLTAGAVAGVSASAHTQLGVYLGTVPLIVISALTYAWTPIILSAPESEQGARLEETARTVAWLAATGASTVALLSPWLLRIFASSDYDLGRIVPVTAVVTLSAVVAVVFMAHTQLVLASGHTGAFGYLSPLALVLGTALGVVASRWMDLAGMGLGYLSTYLFLALFTRHLARRRSSVRWRDSVVAIPALVATAASLTGALAPFSGAGAVIRWGIACVLMSCAIRMFARIMKGRGSVSSPPDSPATETDPLNPKSPTS